MREGAGGRGLPVTLAFRLARRELRGGVRGLWIVLLCLALGVSVIAAVGSLRAATDSGLAADGRRILATAGATNLLLVTLLMPVGAVWLGMALLGEHLHAGEVVGMALIALGLVAIDGRLLGLVGLGRLVAAKPKRAAP